MKTYKYCDAPLEVHGLPFFAENGKLERIPAEERAKFPLLGFLGRRCPGARVCFRTNAAEFTVRLELETLTPDVGMAIFACQAINVMIGERKTARFAGLVNPPSYDVKTAEKTFRKSSDMEDITLFLPRNEIIASVEISVPDGAKVEAPTPYAHGTVLYYGSSITEGGCCQRMTNAYNAIISTDLDCDYYNYGFSGSARGELEMADLINRIEMSVLVYGYDHNAPTVEHLKNTHEPFFKRIREAHPDLPVIMVTRPTYHADSDADARAEVIYATYKNAVDSGDERVWFIDGREFFGDKAPMCSCDDCHPNDLGFYLMAEKIKPYVENALKIAEGK